MTEREKESVFAHTHKHSNFRSFIFIFINIIMDDGLAASLENIIRTPSTYYKVIGFGCFVRLCAQQQQYQQISESVDWNKRHMAPKKAQYIITCGAWNSHKTPLYAKKQIFCKYSISRECQRKRERDRVKKEMECLHNSNKCNNNVNVQRMNLLCKIWKKSCWEWDANVGLIKCVCWVDSWASKHSSYDI